MSMKKWTAVDLDDYRGVEPSGADTWSVVYLAPDVDARIAELEAFIKVLLPSWPDGDEYPTEMSVLSMQRQEIAELEKLLREVYDYGENMALHRQIREALGITD